MRNRRPPQYLRHRARDLGYSRIDGKQVYFPGRWNSAESKSAYDAKLKEWSRDADCEKYPLTIADLIVRYTDWADGYFARDGQPTRYAYNIKGQLKLLLESHRHTMVAEFDAPLLAAWRDSLDGRPDKRCKNSRRLITRQYANKCMKAVLRMFRKGVEWGIVPKGQPAELREVAGLQKGHTKAPEAPKVEPASDADVDATLPHLAPQVRAMVEISRLTGMRPGEALVMRPCDITIRPDGVMVYRPHRHKLEHLDIDRLVFIGPKAAEILRPWLDRDAESYCFQPREAVAWQQEQKRASRKSPVQPSQVSRKKPSPQRTARDMYDKDSYARAVRRACLKAGVPVWRPGQLRHSTATLLTSMFESKEAATATLGHSNPATTTRYIKVDYELAARVMRQIG